MNVNRWLVAILLTLYGVASQAAVVTFFTSKAAFDAATTTTTIDFEGIVASNAFSALTPSMVIDGVTFSVSSGTLGVGGANSSVSGSPYDSALLFSNNAAPITADLTSAGSGFTAVGAFFGDIDSAGTTTILRLFGTSGLLDTRTVIAGDMGLGQPDTFFGWTVSGDTIVNVVHDLQGSFEGIDNFQFGRTDAPEPASLALLGLGLAGLGFARRRVARG